MKWRWWRNSQRMDHEALDHLRKLEQRDPEVESLGRELRERQRQNNFSSMVSKAIARSAQEEP